MALRLRRQSSHLHVSSPKSPRVGLHHRSLAYQASVLLFDHKGVVAKMGFEPINRCF